MAKAMIDHLVIGAEELEKATQQVQDFLKAKFLKGGKHPLMATHNSLIKLQKSLYLEIIAIDPGASFSKNSAGQNRWFSLDDHATKERLSRGPQPLCWVVAVENIEQALAHCGYNPGKVIVMTRGNFNWKITVPENGNLPEGGILPILIEWPNGSNPTSTMPESSIFLEELTLFHSNPIKIRHVLSKLKIDGPIKVVTGEPSMQFSMTIQDGKSVVFQEDCLARL